MSSDCERVREQLGEYLDEDALRELCEVIEGHLTHCHDCRIVVDQLRKTIVLYRGDQPIEMPPRVSADLRAALAREYMRAERAID